MSDFKDVAERVLERNMETLRLLADDEQAPSGQADNAQKIAEVSIDAVKRHKQNTTAQLLAAQTRIKLLEEALLGQRWRSSRRGVYCGFCHQNAGPEHSKDCLPEVMRLPAPDPGQYGAVLMAAFQFYVDAEKTTYIDGEDFHLMKAVEAIPEDQRRVWVC